MTKNGIVRVHLSGGLGNQLNQFFAAKKLASRFQSKIHLDISWYKRSRFKRNPLATSEFTNYRLPDLLRFSFLSNLPIGNSRIMVEGRFERIVKVAPATILNWYGIVNESNFFERSSRKKIHLVGNFMNNKYFDLEDARNTFAIPLLRPSKRERNQYVIGVHIRLGDYVTLGDKIIPSQDYYLNGCRTLSNMLKGYKIKLKIFSDDIILAKKRFSQLQEEFDYNWCTQTDPIKSLQELYACDTIVCSNSTFSYWGSILRADISVPCVRPSSFYTEKYPEDTYECLWGLNYISLDPFTGEIDC